MQAISEPIIPQSEGFFLFSSIFSKREYCSKVCSCMNRVEAKELPSNFRLIYSITAGI